RGSRPPSADPPVCQALATGRPCCVSRRDVGSLIRNNSGALSTHFAQHTPTFRRYAESGWWDGVPHVSSVFAPASESCPLRCDPVRKAFEFVCEGLEPGRLPAAGVRERLRQDPIGEPRIAGQERAVEIGADRPPEPATLVS